jgi:hypothetical protein
MAWKPAGTFRPTMVATMRLSMMVFSFVAPSESSRLKCLRSVLREIGLFFIPHEQADFLLADTQLYHDLDVLPMIVSRLKLWTAAAIFYRRCFLL